MPLVIPVVFHYDNVKIKKALQLPDPLRIRVSVHRKLLDNHFKLPEQFVLIVYLLSGGVPKAIVQLEDIFRQNVCHFLAVFDAV
jgi:hypothetical protein